MYALANKPIHQVYMRIQFITRKGNSDSVYAYKMLVSVLCVDCINSMFRVRIYYTRRRIYSNLKSSFEKPTFGLPN